MTDYEIVEDKCRNNCELYERCIRCALKNRTVRCIYFEKIKNHVETLIEDYKQHPQGLRISPKEIKLILRRK